MGHPQMQGMMAQQQQQQQHPGLMQQQGPYVNPGYNPAKVGIARAKTRRRTDRQHSGWTPLGKRLGAGSVRKRSHSRRCAPLCAPCVIDSRATAQPARYNPAQKPPELSSARSKAQ